MNFDRSGLKKQNIRYEKLYRLLANILSREMHTVIMVCSVNTFNNIEK